MTPRRWTIRDCSVCGFESLDRTKPQGSALDHAVHTRKEPGEFEVEVIETAPVREALREAMRFVSRGGHDTTCPIHLMHDDFYENPAPDEHPSYPRICDCHVEVRADLEALLRDLEGKDDG